VKKILVIVLAVILMTTLLLPGAAFARIIDPGPTYVTGSKLLTMEYCDLSAPMGCGPLSGVSIGQYYRNAINRDGVGVVSEDFEWGSNGTSLDVEPPLGNVDWTVSASGGSYARIDIGEATSGTRSARFHHDGLGGVIQASYSKNPPTYIKFYFKKDVESVFYMSAGDGTHRILVKVDKWCPLGEDWDRVQYYHDGVWDHVYARPCNQWHCIEFKNIDWAAGTYDVWVDDQSNFYLKYMDHSSAYSGTTAYWADSGGTFWIDDILDKSGDYPDLPIESSMLSDLYTDMKTSETGGTYGPNYGPGFVQMTSTYGYHDFSYVYDGSVTDGDYWAIVNAIDNGWPVALGGELAYVPAASKDGTGQWPPTKGKGHYIAIRGYEWEKVVFDSGEDYIYRRIICTDSLSSSNKLVLSWDEVINKGSNLKTITIRDNLIEDFEWGANGDSLSKSLGYVNWRVQAGGYSKAVITTTYKHSGTKGARIYYDGNYPVVAWYYQSPPSFRGFYVRKDSSAFFGTTNGNGIYRACVVMDTNEMLKYLDPYSHDVIQLDDYTWYLIELKNMNYVAGTFDIYVDGNLVKQGAKMMSSSSYNGQTAYYDLSSAGSFYIDDIYK